MLKHALFLGLLLGADAWAVCDLEKIHKASGRPAINFDEGSVLKVSYCRASATARTVRISAATRSGARKDFVLRLDQPMEADCARLAEEALSTGHKLTLKIRDSYHYETASAGANATYFPLSVRVCSLTRSASETSEDTGSRTGSEDTEEPTDPSPSPRSEPGPGTGNDPAPPGPPPSDPRIPRQ